MQAAQNNLAADQEKAAQAGTDLINAEKQLNQDNTALAASPNSSTLKQQISADQTNVNNAKAAAQALNDQLAADNQAISNAQAALNNTAKATACTGLNALSSMLVCFVLPAAEWLGNMILDGFGVIVWAATAVLNITIVITVINMSTLINGISSINTVWTFFRDLSNMFFIFVLTFAGVQTILNVGNWKNVLKNVIIAGLLINFSLLITKIPIDISNIFSLQLYNAAIGTTNGSYNATTLTGTFLDGLKIKSIYNPSDNSALAPTPSVLGSVNELYIFYERVFLGATLMVTVSFVFLIVALMLVLRFMKLVYAMVISPLFFLGMILPGVGRKVGNQWADNLLSQCIFAPVFFLLMYVSVIFIKSGVINTISMSANAQAGANAAASFTSAATIAAAIGGNTSAFISLIISYSIILGLIIGSLMIAIEMGGQGNKFLQSMGNKAKLIAIGGVKMTTRGALAPVAKPVEIGAKIATRGAAEILRPLGKVPVIGRGANLLRQSAEKASRGNLDFRDALPLGGDKATMFVSNTRAKELDKQIKETDLKLKAEDEANRRKKDFKKEVQEYSSWHTKEDTEGRADTDMVITDEGKSITIAEFKKRRDAFGKLLRERTSKELDEMSSDDVKKLAEVFTYKQIEQLTGKDSKLLEADKKELKRLRKEMLKKPLEVLDALKGSATATEEDKEKARKKLRKLIRSASSAEIAEQDGDFLSNDEILVLLDKDDMKKIEEKGVRKSVKVGGVDRDFYDYAAERAKDLEKASFKPGSTNQRVKSMAHMTNKDNAGLYYDDPAKVEAELTKDYNDQKTFALGKLGDDNWLRTNISLTKERLDPTEETDIMSAFNINEAASALAKAPTAVTPAEAEAHYLKYATSPRIRILKEQYK